MRGIHGIAALAMLGACLAGLVAWATLGWGRIELKDHLVFRCLGGSVCLLNPWSRVGKCSTTARITTQLRVTCPTSRTTCTTVVALGEHVQLLLPVTTWSVPVRSRLC